MIRALPAALALLFSAAPAVAAKPVLDSVVPAAGAPGTAVLLESADIHVGSAYAVTVGERFQALVATEEGRVRATVPAQLCAATYPVSLNAAGQRSNAIPFTVSGGAAGCNYGCAEVVPDFQYLCTYRPVDAARNDVLFLQSSDNRIYAADADAPGSTPDPVLDPFTETGWQPLAATVDPSGERMIVARRKSNCATQAPGPGLSCSYGRETAWLAHHWVGDPNDPGDDRWVHINLAKAYGLNSHALYFATWLHERRVLVPILILPPDAGWVSDPAAFNHRILSIEFSASGFPTRIAPYAPAALARSACFTGRVHAQLSETATSCTAGQRIVFTRRCWDDPDPSAWTWWNSTDPDGPAARCNANLPQYAAPILRSYVAELDASCEPTHSFEELVPLREPPRDALHRRMGVAPEWGDLGPVLSPDGQWAAVTTLTGNPNADPNDACQGFAYNLSNLSDPLSGNAARRLQVCAIDPTDSSCEGPDDAMQELGALLSPPENQARPNFATLGGALSLLTTWQWSQVSGGTLRDLSRLDFESGPAAFVPLGFGSGALSAEAIPRAAPDP